MLSLKHTQHQKIKEIFPKINGLFTHINFDFGVEKKLLDIMWLGRYGLKNPSPEVEIVQSEKWEVLSDDELELIGEMILALYLNKWEKLKVLPEIEYDPIHNYLDEWQDNSNGWEKRDDTITSQREDKFGKIVKTEGVRTDDLVEINTIDESEVGSNSQTNALFGFNSTSAVDSDVSDGGNTKKTDGTDSTVNTGTQKNEESVADSGSETREYKQTDDFSGSDNRDRSGTHLGNIGNLTSQKMLNEEIELWKWNFINMVLEDVRDFCTLPIYRR